MQHPGHKRARAINGVNDPSQTVTRLIAILFSDNTVRWILSSNCIAHHTLYFFINVCHRIKLLTRGFIVNRKIGSESRK